MEPDFSPVVAHLEATDADAYLIADRESSDQVYLSGFDGTDALAVSAAGDVHLLVSGLEYGRAKRVARADAVHRHADFEFEYGDRESRYDMYAAFLETATGTDADGLRAAVPDDFPLALADALRGRNLGVVVDDDGVVSDARAVKAPEEVEHVRRAQAANEAAMAAAEELIAGATVAGDGEYDPGTLLHDGEPLTSARVKEEIEVTLLRHGCALDETIVACGPDAGDPHERGSGPLSAGEPIVIDIFPESKSTGYHSDMTRTFSRGEPSGTIREWFDRTREALEAALDVLEPGATGEDVHAAACDVYEDAGEPTLRSDPETETGFIHSTGHGVGLDVHEKPSLSPSGGELEPGHVVTVEPGLYDPAVGGVRIEDVVVVTDDGYENLTDYPAELVVG